MSKIFLPLITLIALISLIFNFKYVLQKQNANFKVTQVIDGDTFKIDFEGGKRVRLLGINAPETGKCLSQEAKEKLEKLVLNKTVSLTDQFTDPYGRIMANVFVENVYINKEMSTSGFVRLDYTTNPRRDELKVGYFHDDKCISIVSPKNCVIKGNVDTSQKPYKAYLIPGCRNYSQAKIDLSTEDQWFCTEKEALDAGFIKSSTCP